MGIVLLVFVVAIPVAMLAFSFVWDHHQKRLTGSVPTVTRRKTSFAADVVAPTLEGMVSDAERQPGERDPNYGNLGPK